MTQRFLVHEKAVAGPATHAIIIGVGAYPHLNGGTPGGLTPDHDGMGQLSSPPISARMFADWLIRSFNHPDKPLATVALLVSAAAKEKFVNPATDAAYDVEPATAAAAIEAIKAWKERGDTEAGNLMLFYFCGHGITEGTDTALLLADFGADRENSLDGALDLRKLWLGLQRCRATEQCFFIDACRVPSNMLAAAAGFVGKVPIKPGPRDPNWEKPVRAPIFYATFNGAKAYGLPGAPSLYSQVLMKALAGWGADDENDTWRVTTSRLAEALENAVARKAREFDRLQLTTADGMTKIYLHHLSTGPSVPVYVKSEPPLASICDVTLTYGTSGGAMTPAPSAGRADTDWEIEASAGTYDFAAAFPTGERCEVRNMMVRPPFKPVTMRKMP
jgi:Caspase domain